MPTKAKKAEYQRTYRKKHREQLKKYNDAYTKSHRGIYAKSSREWYHKNKERVALIKGNCYIKIKLDVFTHYGNGKIKCANCGVEDSDVLCIDHIDACGNAQRRIRGLGSNFYRWLRNNGYPRGFQILCANCNMKKEMVRRRTEGKLATPTRVEIGKLF